MIIKQKSSRKKWIIFFLLLGCLAAPAYSKIDNWLWKIEKSELKVSEFARDYNIYIELMAWQMGTTTDALEVYLTKSDELADPRTRGIIEQMKPEQFAENFLTLSLLKKHAIENKFFDQPANKEKREFISDYIMVQMYLSEIILKSPVEIKDSDVEKEWIAERDKNENLKSIPIEQGLVLMRQKMIQDRRDNLRKDFIKSLSERYKVEKNPEYAAILSTLKFSPK